MPALTEVDIDDIDDLALIAAYRQASATYDATAKHHAAAMSYLGTWLRVTHDDNGQPRPTLSRLKDMLMASGERAIDNPHVQAFRASQAGTELARGQIGGALDALVRGNTKQGPVRAADISNQALIAAYREASGTDPVTAKGHGSLLAHLGTWLRTTPDDDGQRRPTLNELRGALIASGERATDNRHVRAFRTFPATTDSLRTNINGALDALVRGNTARVQALAPAAIDDRALIAAYLDTSATDHDTALHHAGHLAHFGTWLRATPDANGQPRPTLHVLQNALAASGGRAIENPHVQAFRVSHAGTEWARAGIGGALDALVSGNTRKPVLAGDSGDQELIADYRQAFAVDDGTSQHHATSLAHLSTWLHETPGDNGQPRPTLRELKDTLTASGGRAIDDPHVQAFQASQAATDSARKNASGALDALVRGKAAQRPLLQADISDQALIAAFRQASTANTGVAKDYATFLAHLGTWLRATPDDIGLPRPTLGELKNILMAAGDTAIDDNPHVQAFKTSQAGSKTARERIGLALNGLIRGNATQTPLQAAHASDRALISAYVRAATKANPKTVQNHANYLAHLGTWLRNTPDDEGQARPTLSELKDMLVASRQRASKNPHVQAFKTSQVATPSVRTNTPAALDALVRTNPTQRHGS
ncbi:MAG: hypothetical protein IOC33_02710 [Burkholderia sp.]|nr:hypothetical protein [Burkholderia sp.]